MSFIQPAAVKAIALSVDVTHLSDEAAKALAPDVEYRLREVIQDALKFARHSKRTKLTTQDINNALRLRNIEPMYGFLHNNDPAKFVRATGHPDVYFVRDATVPLEQITCAPLPRAPNHTTVMPHWLFIDGVQPQTEENAAVERPPPPPKRPRLAAAAAAGAGPGSQQQQPGTAAGAGQEGPAGRRRDAAVSGGPLAQAGGAGAPAAGAGAEGAAGAPGTAAGSVSERVQMPVQHILSDELQRLLGQIKVVLVPVQDPTAAAPAAPAAADGTPLWGSLDEAGGGGSSALVLNPMQRAVLTTMQSDPGMQQLLPYLTKHVADEVAGGLRQLPRLHMVLRILQALLLNPHVQLEPYLHQLMPPLLTCCLAKSLGSSLTADHWSLRDSAAALVARLCNRFGEPFYSLQVKVSKQLIRALLDGSKPLTSHYGAVAGLAAMGHATVRLLLLPQLQPYVTKLKPALEARKEGVRQYEATRVYGALLAAAGSAMYDKLVGAAADGLLPVHLFRGGRSRRPLPGDGTKQPQQPGATPGGSAAAAPPTPAPTYTKVAPPPPNPEFDALWDQTRTQNPGLQEAFNSIAASPADPKSLAHLSHLRNLAVDANSPSSRTAQAMLHQLAKRGIGPPAPPPATSPAPAAGSPEAGAAKKAAASGSGRGAAGAGGEEGKERLARADAGSQAGGRSGAASIGRAVALHGAPPPGRTPRDVLADSWREDADLGEVVWALTELFGPAFLAWLPQPPALASMTI